MPRLESFEQVVLPHMKAAYNLARWLLRNDHDAEDVMQEAIVRAFRFYDGFSGNNPRAWLLTVVRNSAYTFLQQNRARERKSLGGGILNVRGELNSPVEPRLHTVRVARSNLDRTILQQ